MSKIRKYLCVLLLCVLAFELVACGGGNSGESSEKESGKQESQVVEQNLPEEGSFEEYQANFTAPAEYAAAVVVTINPEARLYLDEDNNILAVEYLNADAKDAYEELALVGTSYTECLEKMVQSAIDKEYLKENKDVTVTVEEVVSEKVSITTLNAAAEETVAQVTSSNDMTANIVVKVDETVEQTVAETKCPDCNGTGNNCAECGGVGIVNCKRCNNGQESCGTCKGTAQITCHGCKGSGDDGHGATCNYCGGSGIMSCDACHGQGTFLCSWCKGELKHICPICEGHGTCSTCGGDGIL